MTGPQYREIEGSSYYSPPIITVPIPKGQCTAKITPKWFVCGSEYHPQLATFRPLVNGEEAFGEVYRAIDAAKKSVCIICWGFQPSMHFIRDGTKPSIGELLLRKAKDGRVVRVLSWACDIVGDVPVTGIFVGEPNTPGRWKPGFYKDKPDFMTTDQYMYNVWWFTLFDRQWKNMLRSPAQAGKNIVKTLIDPEKAYKAYIQKVSQWTDAEYEKAYKNLQFYSRSYSGEDSKNLRQLNYLDAELSLSAKLTMAYTPTHHQKMVIVDHEDPEAAVGFVMGHNMLDGYWDTPDHSGTPKPPDCGRNGAAPLHDYSSRVTGPIIGDLFCNFADAWRKETKENLRKPNFPSYPLKGNDAQALCQILRTQPQYAPPRMDIAKCYLQAVSNATQCIVIENQYFRWPTLAEKITEAAARMTAGGRNPAKHGFLYLFVITNTSDGGMGSGTVNTYRMLEALGRADRLPEVARHERVEALDRELKAAEKELKAVENALAVNTTKLGAWLRDRKAVDDIAPYVTRDLSYRYDPINKKLAELKAERKQLEDRKRQIEARMRELEDRKTRLKPPAGSKRDPEAIAPRDVPGLKVHIATLVAPDTADKEPWQEVYIHAKLMMIDDTFMTLGSANINSRSMQTDSELNIMHDRYETTKPLRERQWERYTRGKNMNGKSVARIPPGTPLETAFVKWGELMNENAAAKKKPQGPLAQLHEFLRTSETIKDLD